MKADLKNHSTVSDGGDYHGRYEPQHFGVGGLLSEECGVAAIC